jgi:hypothetical protein
VDRTPEQKTLLTIGKTMLFAFLPVCAYAFFLQDELHMPVDCSLLAGQLRKFLDRFSTAEVCEANSVLWSGAIYLVATWLLASLMVFALTWRQFRFFGPLTLKMPWSAYLFGFGTLVFLILGFFVKGLGFKSFRYDGSNVVDVIAHANHQVIVLVLVVGSALFAMTCVWFHSRTT